MIMIYKCTVMSIENIFVITPKRALVCNILVVMTMTIVSNAFDDSDAIFNPSGIVFSVLGSWVCTSVIIEALFGKNPTIHELIFSLVMGVLMAVCIIYFIKSNIH